VSVVPIQCLSTLTWNSRMRSSLLRVTALWMCISSVLAQQPDKTAASPPTKKSGEPLGIPVKVNADSSGKPNGYSAVKVNSRRSEGTLA
jgi:hypothetical protein